MFRLGQVRQRAHKRELVGGVLLVAVQDALDEMQRPVRLLVEAGESEHRPADPRPAEGVVGHHRLIQPEADPLEQELQLGWRQFGEQAPMRVAPGNRIDVRSLHRNGYDQCASRSDHPAQAAHGIEHRLLRHVHQHCRAQHGVELGILERLQRGQGRIEHPPIHAKPGFRQVGRRHGSQFPTRLGTEGVIAATEQFSQIPTGPAAYIEHLGTRGKGLNHPVDSRKPTAGIAVQQVACTLPIVALSPIVHDRYRPRLVIAAAIRRLCPRSRIAGKQRGQEPSRLACPPEPTSPSSPPTSKTRQ